MSARFYKLTIGSAGPVVVPGGASLATFFDGARRVIFADDATDVSRAEGGDVVVMLGGIGRDADGVASVARALERAGAAGLLVHERRIQGRTRSVSEGAFPVVLVDGAAEWDVVLAPLLGLAELLGGKDAAPANDGSATFQEIVESGGVVSASGPPLLDATLYRALVVQSAETSPAAILSRIAPVVAAETSEAAVFEAHGSVVVVGPDACVRREDDAFPAKVLGAVTAAADKVAVGVGRSLAGADGVLRSYREAAWAARVALRTHATSRVAYFADMGADAWLESIDAHLDEDAVEAVVRLVEHDAQHGSNLVETLRVALESRQMREAAAALFLHRNTLRYRLDSIQKITGLDPRDPEAKLVLQLQLRLAVVRGVIAPQQLPAPAATSSL